jgi:hypothetical protein
MLRIQRQTRRFSTQWISQRLSELQKTQPEKTVAIVVDHSEVAELDKVLPAGLAQSKEFLQDLKMSNSYWFYHGESM